jgi:hypothetical protein
LDPKHEVQLFCTHTMQDGNEETCKRSLLQKKVLREKKLYFKNWIWIIKKVLKYKVMGS